MIPPNLKFAQIIRYDDNIDRLSKTVLHSTKPRTLFIEKGKTSSLFDSKHFRVISLQRSLGIVLSEDEQSKISDGALSSDTIIILKPRMGYLLSNTFPLQKNLEVKIIIDENGCLHYLMWGFKESQDLILNLKLIKDQQSLISHLAQQPKDSSVESKITTIFNTQSSDYNISFTGIGYIIKFGPAGDYPIDDNAGIRFCIAAIRLGNIPTSELIAFGNKYFKKSVNNDIDVIRRARRNKEELIKKVITFEQTMGKSKEISLSKHLEDSIVISEADYTIKYTPVSPINWSWSDTFPNNFFSLKA